MESNEPRPPPDMHSCTRSLCPPEWETVSMVRCLLRLLPSASCSHRQAASVWGPAADRQVGGGLAREESSGGWESCPGLAALGGPGIIGSRWWAWQRLWRLWCWLGRAGGLELSLGSVR